MARESQAGLERPFHVVSQELGQEQRAERCSVERTAKRTGAIGSVLQEDTDSVEDFAVVVSIHATLDEMAPEPFSYLTLDLVHQWRDADRAVVTQQSLPGPLNPRTAASSLPFRRESALREAADINRPFH